MFTWLLKLIWRYQRRKVRSQEIYVSASTVNAHLYESGKRKD